MRRALGSSTQKLTYGRPAAGEASDAPEEWVEEPAVLRQKLTEALEYRAKLDARFSRRKLAATMRLGSEKVLRDFVGEKERVPTRANRKKIVAWLAAHPTPPEPLDAESDKFDFFLNYELVAGLHLTGCEFARAQDFFAVTGLADLNKNFDTRVKAELACVALQMDSEDTNRVIKWCCEIGDKRLGFDAGHGQNRNSKHAYGTFMTHVLGLCALCQVTDKDRSNFCAGVAQRGEKEALLTGLRRLVDLGLVPENVATDQCSGASVDIANVARALGLAIVHDWDTYHVIVTIKKKWEAYIAAKCKHKPLPPLPVRPGAKSKKPKNMNVGELDAALRTLFSDVLDLEVPRARPSVASHEYRSDPSAWR